MKEHTWKTEERDGGIDFYDATFCTVCYAHQSAWGTKKLFYPGPGIDLPGDCDEALKLVETYKQDQRDRVKKAVEYWNSVANEPDKVKVSLRQYLGWWEKEYETYLATGEPPFDKSWGYENRLDYMFECNNKCPSCCLIDHDD